MSFLKVYVSILIFLLHTTVYSQIQTVGMFNYSPTAEEGFTLFSSGKTTYLIDNCGYKINEWNSSYAAGSSAYLLNSGELLRTCRIQNPIFSGGGSGGRIELRSWDNVLLWSYNFSNNTYHQHHDIEPMPNGNILILCWEYRSFNEAIQAGRNINGLADNELWSTYIIEIEPLGSDSMKVVWEWRLWDHLVQDYDSTKNNYGIVENSKQKLDLNFYSGSGKKDWLHCNSIDYNSSIDQILISSRNLSEFYIIDHSTTTAQAASSSGGNFNTGGDFLYRWGNPQSYNSGNVNDKKLFGQHDVKWIDEGFIDEKKIILFNNGLGRGYSSIDIIDTKFQNNGYYLIDSNNRFVPDEKEWTYVSNNLSDFYSSYISGSQRLRNGNTLICNGAYGTFFEIDQQGNEVWKYVNPVVNNMVLSQGDSIPSSNNGLANNVFRAEKYYTDFSGFIGHDITPKNPIENNPLVYNCQMISNTYKNQFDEKKILKIVDVMGRQITKKKNSVIIIFYENGQIEKNIILN